MKLLVIEDEADLADLLIRGMAEEGHAVTVAPDGRTGLALASATAFDIILLDLNLPDISGFAVSQTLRINGVQTPILMLTARDDVEDRITGLRTGADDYLVKPFAFGELLARMEAVLRRTGLAAGLASGSRSQPSDQPPPLPDRLDHGPLSIDYPARKAVFADVPLKLTAKELEILRIFMAHPARIYSRHEILRLVWGLEEDPLTNIVEVYISRLRRKLAGAGGNFIDNVRGFGYRLQLAD